MYSLLLRSCKLLGAFIIHPCLPFCRSHCQAAGPLRSTAITPLPCYYWPLRHPLAFPPTSWFCQLYGFLASVDFSIGTSRVFSSCLAHPCHRAAALTPPECPAASASLRRSMMPSPHEGRLGLWGRPFRGQLCVHFCCGISVPNRSTRSAERRQWEKQRWFKG